jgi:glucose/arabinose dehydrogenase
MSKIAIGILILLAIFLGTYFYLSSKSMPSELPINTINPEIKTNNQSSEDINSEVFEIIAENLDTPWEIEFIPNGEILVTERPGNLIKIDEQGNKQTIAEIGEVAEIGEGGLMGMALHPDFEDNNFIYLYFTSQLNGSITNKIVRYELVNNALQNPVNIVENIPAENFHNGGRIAFGPDGYLYVTTGDAGVTGNSQDTNSLSGKILRITDNGAAPPDNPFNNRTFSYGHRNPQGLVWDNNGRLWATEHGPSGSETGNDEVNLIESGKNYGWPNIRGTQTQNGMEIPYIESGRGNTWAPSSLAFFNGTLYFGGLRGEALYKLDINNQEKRIETLFRREYGRIRIVKIGPDGYLYIGTSNNDERGNPAEGDDKIIRMSLP